jgi:Flp pilus assembly protein TadB
MEKSLTSEESLSIITEMISKAKKDTAGDGGFQLLLWGWVIAICNLGHYALGILGYERPYMIWWLVVPAVFVSFWHGFKNSKKERIKSHISQVVNQLWMVVFAGIMITLAFMPVLGFNQNPVILIITGIGMFVTGALIQVSIVRNGGVLLLAAAVIAFLLPVSQQFLLSGIAVILGYLVPGYYMKKKYRERV